VTVEFHAPLSVDSAGGRKALAVAAEAIVRRGQARALSGRPPERAPEATAALPQPALAEAAA